jgi:iron complex outermembrane receptor protein
LYGGNPLSGTINLVTKQPLFQNFINIAGFVGSFQTVRGTADIGFVYPGKKVATRLNGIWQKSNSYRDDKTNDIFALNPTLSWHPNSTTQVNINLEYYSNNYKPDTGLPLVFDPVSSQLNVFPDISRRSSFQTPFDKSEQTLLRFKAGITREINSKITFQNRFYYTDLDWTSKGTILNGAFPTPSGSYYVSRSFQLLDDRQKLLGDQLEFKFSSGSSKIRNTILTGLEVSRLEDDFTIDVVSEIPPIGLNNPVETFQEHSIQAFPYQFGSAITTVVAPYIFDVISIQNNLHIFAGGRYDFITFQDELNTTDREYKKFSPMLGMSYEFVSNTTVYTSAGKAFAPPSSRVLGAPEAEESKQIEVGLKRNWLGGKIRSTIALYNLEKENIAIPDRTGLSKQIGNQRSRGFEFEVSGQLSEKCASLFSYSYTDAELTNFAESVILGINDAGYPIEAVFDRSGNTAAFVPKHIVNFWHTRDIGDHFGFGAGFRYVGEQYIYTEYEMRGFGASSVIPASPFALFGSFEINY